LKQLKGNVSFQEFSLIKNGGLSAFLEHTKAGRVHLNVKNQFFSLLEIVKELKKL
jgi:hypothetical protein